MSKHLHRDLEELKRELLIMGSMVQESINKAIVSLEQRRPELAEEVMRGDDEIDSREVKIEEDCLKVLALHQPVARDLRWVVCVMKVNNDLERMGDLAINIAERACYLSSHKPLDSTIDFNRMLQIVREMVRDSLDALVDLDTGLARQVINRDDEVDAINAGMFTVVEDLMRRDPDNIDRAIHTLSCSRHLERIADLATNIAEDVIFLVHGEVVRHRLEQFRHLN